MNLFLDNLLLSIQDGCQIHAQRQLSIRGRATVLNTLVLSRLWHVLRLVGAAPSRFFRKLRSICGRFLNTRMFPIVSYKSLCQPRSFGGVNILDPLLQQSTLQLRWLEPIFNLSTSSSYVTSCLCHHLLVSTATYTDPRLPLVFPALRSRATSDPSSVAYLLYRAIDLLPINWTTTPLSAATILHLPLNVIWTRAAGHEKLRRPGFASMSVSDIFVFDHDIGHIRRRNATDGIFRRILTTRFFSDLANGRIFLVDGFARLCLPQTHPGGGHTGALGLIDGAPLLHHLSQTLSTWQPKRYRLTCARTHHTVHDIPSASWSTFWLWPMEHTARNIWFRALRGTLPTAAKLHRRKVPGVDSPLCRLCQEGVDDTDHFLVLCPQKLRVWRRVWSKLYAAEPVPRALVLFITTLQLPPTTPRYAQPRPSHALTVACTLQAIWQAYWRVIFDNEPFLPDLITARALSLLERFRCPTV